MNTTLSKVFFTLILGLAPALSHAAATTQLGLQEIASGLSNPVFVSAAPGDSQRLYIVLQAGQIVVYENGGVRPTPMLNITTRITSGGERGLLGLAFHPQYQGNGYFYVNSTRTVGGQLRTYITRYTQSDPAAALTVDPATEIEILSFDQPFPNHAEGSSDPPTRGQSRPRFLFHSAMLRHCKTG